MIQVNNIWKLWVLKTFVLNSGMHLTLCIMTPLPFPHVLERSAASSQSSDSYKSKKIG